MTPSNDMAEIPEPPQDPASMTSRTLSRVVWLTGMILCLVVFVTSLVILLAPYSLVRTGLDVLAPDGQAEFFNTARYDQARSWAQVLGVAAGLLLAAGGIQRSRLLAALDDLQPVLKRAMGRFWIDLVSLGRVLRGGSSGQEGLPRRGRLLALLLITGLAVGIRLAYLFSPIRYDEAYSFLVFAMQPVKVILTDYHVPNNHIFHTLLMRMAYLLTGNHIWSLRLPVFVAGVLLVPATYMVAALVFGKGALTSGKGALTSGKGALTSGKGALTSGKGALTCGKGARVFNPAPGDRSEEVRRPDHAAGLLASTLAAASTTLVEFSTNARGYMWICLLTMIIIWLAVYVKDRHNRAAWVFLVLFSAIGLFTVPVFLYPFGMVMSWLLLSWLVGDVRNDEAQGRRSRFLGAWLAAGAATALLTLLLYLPLIRAGGMDDLAGNRFVSAVEASGFGESIQARMRASWADWVKDLPVLGTMTLVIGFGTAVFSNRRLTESRLPLPLVGPGFIFLVVWLQRVTPWPRIWIFLLPVFLVWAAGGLVAVARSIPPLMRLPARLRAATFLVLVCLLAAGMTWNIYRAGSVLDPSQAWGRSLAEEQAAAIFLASEVGDGDVIGTAIPVNYPLRYYLLLEGIHQDVLFRKTSGKSFERALVVVHRGYGQTLADVLKKTRLDEFVDEGRARLVYEVNSSQVFEITRR
jgi:hypothetical protein